MLDQLCAYHPVTGKLHSCSPDYPDYDFEAAMLRQGYRVERVPAQVVRELYFRRRASEYSGAPGSVRVDSDAALLAAPKPSLPQVPPQPITTPSGVTYLQPSLWD